MIKSLICLSSMCDLFVTTRHFLCAVSLLMLKLRIRLVEDLYRNELIFDFKTETNSVLE